MRTKKNTLPVAPFNLREMGPTAQAQLTKSLGFFRFAHGTGADRRATIDPEPCPKCKGTVEWALTYRRERGEIVPYIYARCRKAPKGHRWDFSHWKPAPKPVEKTTPTTAEAMVKALEASIATEPGAKPPMPRPSVGTGQRLVSEWIDSRLKVLETELKDLTEMRRIAAHFGPIPPPAWVAEPKGEREPNHTPPGVQGPAKLKH